MTYWGAIGNVATAVIRTVNVVVPDTTPPVITLTGANPITITQGAAFTDPGSVVTDNVNTGLIATVTGSVNTAVAGTYTLTYNVSDTAGNVATAVIRTVNVVAPAPVSAPAPAPSGGGGGGGCVISTQSGFDPVLPLLALIAGAWLMVRRREIYN